MQVSQFRFSLLSFCFPNCLQMRAWESQRDSVPVFINSLPLWPCSCSFGALKYLGLFFRTSANLTIRYFLSHPLSRLIDTVFRKATRFFTLLVVAAVSSVRPVVASRIRVVWGLAFFFVLLFYTFVFDVLCCSVIVMGAWGNIFSMVYLRRAGLLTFTSFRFVVIDGFCLVRSLAVHSFDRLLIALLMIFIVVGPNDWNRGGIALLW